MKRKKHSTFIHTILNLLWTLPALFNVFSSVGKAIVAELSFISKNLSQMLFLIMLGFVLTLSSWCCLEIMFFVYLTSLKWKPEAALFFIFLLNLVFILLIVIRLCQQKNKLNSESYFKRILNSRFQNK